MVARLEQHREEELKNRETSVERIIDDVVGPRISRDEGMPPQFEFYRDHFNGVDLFNRLFYSWDYPHKQSGPDPIFVWSMLQVAFVNSWVVWDHIHGGVTNMQRDYGRSIIDAILVPVVEESGNPQGERPTKRRRSQ